MPFWRRLWPSSSRKGVSSLELFRELFGGRLSKSGKTVNYKTALEVATVLACVRVIAEGLAQVPLKLFQQTGREKKLATDHPLYQLLYLKPNSWQSSFEYFETLGFHLALCGRHYSFKNIVRGRIVELIPFEPNTVRTLRDKSGALSYEVTAPDGSKQTFPAESIWHVRGPSWNSWEGLEIVTLAREAIGLSMAIEEQQASFYKNGALVSATLSIDGTLTDEQYKKLKKWIDDHKAGGPDAGGTLILDRAAKYVDNVMKSVDAQTLEQRRHQIEDTCRPFRVMPIMIGFSDKTATYASAEQMFLAHLVHTMSPLYRRIEQSISVNLLSAKDLLDGIYPKFITQGLLRGALKDTALYLTELVKVGIMVRNEAREVLDLNPIDGLDEPLTPANTANAAASAPTGDPKEE
jgi:HK97 family phage portal protein